jgi:hypothetical protein
MNEINNKYLLAAYAGPAFGLMPYIKAVDEVAEVSQDYRDNDDRYERE